MPAKKKAAVAPRRRRRAPKVKVAKRRRSGTRKGGGMPWIPVALALLGGEIAASTLLAKLPKAISPKALVVYAVGHFTNRPAMKELAYALQAAHMAEQAGLKEQGIKMLSGLKIGGSSSAVAATTGTSGNKVAGVELPTVSQAADFAKQAAAVGQDVTKIAAAFA